MDGGRENAGHFVRNHRSVMQGVRGYVSGEGIHAAHGQLVSVYDGFYGPEAFRQPSGKCETVVAEFDAALFPPGGDVTFRVRAHTAFGHFNTAIS